MTRGLAAQRVDDYRRQELLQMVQTRERRGVEPATCTGHREVRPFWKEMLKEMRPFWCIEQALREAYGSVARAVLSEVGSTRVS